MPLLLSVSTSNALSTGYGQTKWPETQGHGQGRGERPRRQTDRTSAFWEWRTQKLGKTWEQSRETRSAEPGSPRREDRHKRAVIMPILYPPAPLALLFSLPVFPHPSILLPPPKDTGAILRLVCVACQSECHIHFTRHVAQGLNEPGFPFLRQLGGRLIVDFRAGLGPSRGFFLFISFSLQFIPFPFPPSWVLRSTKPTRHQIGAVVHCFLLSPVYSGFRTTT